MKTLISVSMMTLALLPAATAQECQDFAAPRLTVAISDLHLGQGRTGESWSPYDDFRWNKALAGLLGYLGTRSQDQADLVIAGDLFELWQHPGVACAGGGKDFGCTLADMEDITRHVVQAHAADLEELGRFASRGRNRVIVVPGNHDAALMLDSVWKIVHPAFKATGGRVCRAASGTWASPDGAVVVEHGHQIGIDVNKFPRWPEVAAQNGGQTRMVKTWGESFVQELYNETEDDYPLIDNVQPMTSALADYLRNEGLLKAVPRDLARFISFNLFDTSWRQKLTLGGPGAKKEAPSWNVAKARKLGWRLFADALPDGDPIREGLRTEPLAAEWKDVRSELDAMAGDASALPPEEVEYLCDQIKIQAALSRDTKDAGRQTCDTELGGALFQRIIPENRRMARHLDKLRENNHAAMKIFIYGHTHSLRSCWEVKVSNGHLIPVFNTGAFHRLVDKDMFEALAASQTPKMTPKEALKNLPLDKLPACYPMVVVDYSNGVPKGKLWNWYMEEGAASGEPIPACDARCALINESLCSTKKGGLCAGVTE